MAEAGHTIAVAGTGNGVAVETDTAGFERQIVQIGDNGSAKAHVGSGGDLYVSLTSPNSAARSIFANLQPYGTLRVSAEPSNVFMDPFDGGTIDTNRWTTSGTQVPTQANGQVTLAPTVGASVNNNSVMVSVPTFTSPGVGFLITGLTVTLEATQTNAVNTHRWWGKGQVTSFTYATPITDGIGFEIDGATGALQCVVYVGGTKYVINSTTVANITSTLNGLVSGGTASGTALPTGAVASAYGAPLTWQGGQHKYALMIRSDVAFWFVEGSEDPVAVLSYVSPNVQGLPMRIHDITNGSATSLAHTFTAGAVAVNDSTGGNQTISDGTYPHRKTKVDAAGNLYVGVAAAPAFEVSAGAGLSATGTLFTVDAAAYQSVKVMLYGTWAGTITWEGSNDNTNWFSMDLAAGGSTGVPTTTITFAGLFFGNVHARWFRARVSAYTSGTVQAIAEFSPMPAAYHTLAATTSQISGSAALADSFANPTEGHIGGDNFSYNGTTWDRMRGNFNTTTGDTGAKTVTFNGATQTNFNARGVTVLLNIGTVSGTTPTLVAKLQASPDSGTTWYDIGSATTASLTATGTYAISVYPAATVVAGTTTSGSVASVSQPLPRTWRVVYTIGGTTPSFTLTNVQVAYIL